MTPPTRTQPTRGFDLYRQSLHLTETHWSWLETEAARRHCTRSDIVAELIDHATKETARE